MLQLLWLARLRERWLGKVVRRPRKRNRCVTLSLEQLETRALLSTVVPLETATPDIIIASPQAGISPMGGDGPEGGFTPQQITQAYNFNQISFTSGATTVQGNGAGQTIAIVDAYNDPTIASDLQAFDAEFNLPNPNLSVIGQTGGAPPTATDPTGGWEGEESLDVEWAHAVAPAANIVLVEANSPSTNDLFTAVDTAANLPGVSVVSMSWGTNESLIGPSETSLDSYFSTPNVPADVAFVAASGDHGPPVNYPAASPYVLGVGGTSLTLNSSGGYGSETVWNDISIGDGSSSGGISLYEPLPSYQVAAVTDNPNIPGGTPTNRAVPDVSYDADPLTGFSVYDSYGGSAVGDQTGWLLVGGTSDAAPQWAGLIAIADQGRALYGESTLGYSQLLPDIYQMPASNFHDITTGSSASSTGGPSYPAGPGYDLATGLGTPIANLVVNSLVGVSVSTQTSNASAIYSPNSQIVPLSATVTNLGSPSSKVNEGTVTFTIKNGNTVIASVQKAVSNGEANVNNFSLPAGTAAGAYTIAVSYSDSSGLYIDVGNTDATLTISPAEVTTAANNFSGFYSPNAQTLTLTANLTDDSIPTDKVSQGVIVFTVKDSEGNTVGTAQGLVSGGIASANFNLPAGQAIGTYTITVAYADPGLGNFLDNGDTGATLTISPAHVLTTASNILTAYSPNSQTVQLLATLADASVPTDTIDEGTVTFTVENSSGSTTLGTVQGNVSDGMARANFNLSAGQGLGNYIVIVSYNSSSGNYADGGDVDGTLSISPANVTTTAGNVSTFYSPNAQSLALSASVADDSIATDTVNEGVVTFTISNSFGVVGSVQGAVSNGTATANFNLPAGQVVGSYTIAVSYNDSLGNFSDNGDNNATLTISPAHVITTAATSNLTFSTAAQTATLNATVADTSIPADLVGAGTVTFTISHGGVIIVRDIYATVSGGTASADFTWSAGRAAGNYTIAVSYADSAGNYTDSGDIGSTLTVTPANVITAADNPPPVVSSSSAQNVTLSASVADTSFPNETVNEGTVTFTVMNGTTVIGTPVSGTVSNGMASAVFSVPGGLAVGNYTVVVNYSDSAGNFTDNGSGDTNGTLSVLPANVVTTANNASAIYSPNTQSLALSATVANTSVPANTVGEGVVTFTIKNGSTTIGTAQGNVIDGTADVNFALPAGQVPGSYTIAVSYSDSAGNFIDAGDTSAILTITPANVTTTANIVATAYSPNTQSLALSASVADASIPTDTVGEGQVTFTVKNGSTVVGSVTGTVNGGTANANFTLPAGQALGTYTISVSYSDSTGNFSDSGDNGSTLTITSANVTTTANNVSAVYSPNTQTLALSANVADASIPTDTVGEGVVTFTVANGSTVLGSVTGNVTGGTANANFSLQGGQAVGSYTISVSYNDSSSHFLDAGDTSATLTVAPASVLTTANNVSAGYSPNTQTLTLSATVADASIPSDTVSQGSVAFTIQSDGATIASATGLVSSGKANASLSWPAGQALGSYTILVSYSDSSGNFSDGGDTGATLTVTPAHVITTAANLSTAYSVNSQPLVLSATVADASVPSDLVTEGTVTFTVQSGGTTLGSVQATVSNGTANANFTLLAGLNAGAYTIAVSYSDSKGYFTDSGDISGTLTIAPASVTTTASATSATFNTASQTLALSANVADPVPTANAVNEGVVTFTILSGSTVLGSVQGTVTGGTANAAFTLPAGLNTGNYTIAVHYSDSQGNFVAIGNNNATLGVGMAATTAQLLQANFSPNYTNLTVTETVTAHVASSTLVNRGTVTFDLSGQTISTNVDGNGNAAITLTVPMLGLLSPQSITIAYADASHNLAGSTDTGTASWQLSSPLLPSYAAFSPNSVTMDLFGLLITFTNGALTDIDYGSTQLVFSYNASGLSQITFDGINLLP